MGPKDSSRARQAANLGFGELRDREAQSRPGRSVVEIGFTTRTGYRIEVLGVDGLVELTVTRGSGTTNYATRGVVGPNGRISANFGQLGRLSLRFRPARHNAGPCSPDFSYQRGLFRGTLNFAGEGNYLGLAVERVKGTFATASGLGCRRSSSQKTLERPGESSTAQASVVLIAASPQEENPARVFLVRTLPSRPSSVLFGAFIKEERGKTSITRAATRLAKVDRFVFDSSLSTASVSPPSPFSGYADYRRDDDGSVSWSGSLDASFPGAENVSFAESGFAAELMRKEATPDRLGLQLRTERVSTGGS